MKLRLVAFAALLLSAVVFARAEDYAFTEAFSRTGAFNAAGEVTLENVNGNVEIRTWDKNEILIEGEKSARTAEELKAIDLSIDVSPGRAAIKVRLPKRTDTFFSTGNIRAAVKFKVTVPARAVLAKISTVNASLTLDGLRGPVTASSVNGAIRGTHLGGPANFETVNGAIRATFDTVTAQQALEFESVNGQITVSLPKDAGFQLKTSVVNGRVSCDFPIELANKSGGKKLSGKIGDGRASLEASAVNGGIHIESK